MPWFEGQNIHLTDSRRLAQELSEQLTADMPQWAVHLRRAPIAVLAAADMPAVLMEIEPPATFGTARGDAHPQWLRQVSESVAKTVERFWINGHKGPIIQDLHE